MEELLSEELGVHLVNESLSSLGGGIVFAGQELVRGTGDRFVALKIAQGLKNARLELEDLCRLAGIGILLQNLLREETKA